MSLDSSNETDEISLTVGRAIAQLRTAAHLSQEKLAELANCHRNNIGLIERGEQCPSIRTLHSIAEALDISASDLLKEAGY